jgi:hypothetical protein
MRRTRKQRGGADCPKGMPETYCVEWKKQQEKKAEREAKEAAENAAYIQNREAGVPRGVLSKNEIERHKATIKQIKNNAEKRIKNSNNENNNTEENENVHEFNETKNI